MRRRPYGYTIVEVMVMAAVALVVFGLLLNVFIVCLQRTQDGRIRVDMQQDAVFALVAWEKDLERTSQRGIRMEAGPPYYIGITQVAGVPTTTLAWSQEVSRWCFDADKRTLSRGDFVRTGNSIASPTPAGLGSLVPIPGKGERVLCEDVEEFSLKDRTGNSNGNTILVIQPLIFRLKLRRVLSTSQRYAEFTVERRYTLRNTF